MKHNLNDIEKGLGMATEELKKIMGKTMSNIDIKDQDKLKRAMDAHMSNILDKYPSDIKKEALEMVKKTLNL